MLVTLSGIDGSGKSTLSHHIQKHLKDSYAIRSRLTWCKFGAHPFMSAMEWFRRWQSAANKTRETRQRAIPAPKRMYYYYLLFFHYLQLIGIFISVRIRRQTVICDRYIYDSMVDVQQEFLVSRTKSYALFDKEWIRKPDLSFWLEVPASLAMPRKPETGAVDYLAFRERLYAHVAGDYSLYAIDASAPIDQVVRRVCEQLDCKIKERSASAE